MVDQILMLDVLWMCVVMVIGLCICLLVGRFDMLFWVDRIVDVMCVLL